MNFKFKFLPFLALGFVAVTPAQALSPSELFKQVSPSVVVVKVYDKRDKLLAFGSGVVIADGVVATNCHVLTTEGARYPEVEYRGKNLDADLREVDVARDLCTLNVTALPGSPAAIGTSKNIEIGDKVYAIGAPEGYKLTLSDGLVSGKREISGNSLIQVTAPISHGSSGGGLFDSDGRLVGITTLTDTTGQALNFAIPAEWIAELPEHSTYSAAAAAADAATAAQAAADADAAAALADAAASAADAATTSADAAASAAMAATEGDDDTPPPRRDRWWTFYEDDEQKIAFDTQTAKITNTSDSYGKADKMVTAWVRWTFPIPRREREWTYSKDITRYVFFCNAKQYSYDQYTWQNQTGDVVRSVTLKSYEIERQDVMPDTIGERMHEAACSP
jgi:hypothetical protein